VCTANRCTGECIYSCTNCSSRHQMVVSDQLHVPAARVEKKNRYRLNRMLCGSQGRSGRFAGVIQIILSIGLDFRQNQFDKISKFHLVAVFIIGSTQTSGEWLRDEKRDHLCNRTFWYVKSPFCLLYTDYRTHRRGSHSLLSGYTKMIWVLPH